MGVFEHPFFCKIKKIEGGPFGDIEKFRRKKSHKAEITCTKNFGHGQDSNQRPSAWQTSKILINLYAQLTLVWQLKEASL